MKKTELLSMLVRDLKALAKKMKISVSERTKKADIVEALLAAARTNKRAEVKKAAPKKAAPEKAAPKKVAARTPVKTPKVAARTAEVKTPKAEAPRKQSAPKRVPATAVPVPMPIAAVHSWKTPPCAEEPLLAQERVADSKFYTGETKQTTVAVRGELPRTYGQDRMVLMTRDPFVVLAYWEATPARLEIEKAWFGWDSKLSVRIYDITGVQFDGRNAVGYLDQEVSEPTGNWYFDLGRPSHSFCADLGLLSPEGRFLTLTRSNYVTMPRDGVSDVIDEEWMLADEEFWKLYGYAEGFPGGLSSSERGLKEMEATRRKRLHEITSPGLFPRERTKARRGK
jgi:hypothetical protein